MTQDLKKLSERQESILRAIIDFYVDHATPAGSKHLRQIYALPWSSATIRKEMAWLERRGYLTHCHTSSGRIPTAHGIRYSVHYLLDEADVSPTVRRRLDQEFAQADPDPIRLTYWVPKLLSRFSRNVAVVQSYHEGTKDYAIAGKEHLLGQPEFADSIKLKDLFHLLEEEEIQDHLFRNALSSGSVHVLIGAEEFLGPYQELFEDVSIVSSSFGARGRTMGTVGVIGTKRMNYQQMISLVNLTAQSMDRKLAQS